MNKPQYRDAETRERSNARARAGCDLLSGNNMRIKNSDMLIALKIGDIES
jgi:hypothetical protein